VVPIKRRGRYTLYSAIHCAEDARGAPGGDFWESELFAKDLPTEGARAEYGRALVEYGTELPTKAEYVQFLGEEKVKKRRREKTMGVCDKIVEGRGEKKCFTNFGSSDTTKKCQLGCVHTVSGGDAHMEEHATVMPTVAAEGTIKGPGRPPRPQERARQVMGK
jgi:hypothetical protein